MTLICIRLCVCVCVCVCGVCPAVAEAPILHIVYRKAVVQVQILKRELDTFFFM